LARHLARRFVHRGEPYDDLVQVASLALVKALDRFDPTVGVQFSTLETRGGPFVFLDDCRNCTSSSPPLSMH
jgi:hypothetical protein